jgi:hypothetical protein
MMMLEIASAANPAASHVCLPAPALRRTQDGVPQVQVRLSAGNDIPDFVKTLLTRVKRRLSNCLGKGKIEA